MKQKKNFFWRKKIQNGRFFKNVVFQNRQFSKFFACFCPYVRQPHDHIGWATLMGFASINSTNPRTDLWNFREKISRIGDFEKRPFWFFFLQMKISPNSYGRLDGSKFWRFSWFPAIFLLCVIKRYTVYVRDLRHHVIKQWCSKNICTEVWVRVELL